MRFEAIGNAPSPGGILRIPVKHASRQTPIDSICVHSDTPSAVSIAAAVRKALEAAGIHVKPFTSA
jgi:hypothetical protein